MKITIIGGTGYAGTAILKEAASRKLDVTSFSRNEPADKIESVVYALGSALDPTRMDSVLDGSDVIIAALSPRGELKGQLGAVYKLIAIRAHELGARLVVVGGFSTLRPALDQPNYVDSGDVQEAYAAEAKELADIYKWLTTDAPAELNWTYAAPAALFGSYNPVVPTGLYRTGGDVALFDADGKSDISGADFALAVIDEVLNPTSNRSIISFAY